MSTHFITDSDFNKILEQLLNELAKVSNTINLCKTEFLISNQNKMKYWHYMYIQVS